MKRRMIWLLVLGYSLTLVSCGVPKGTVASNADRDPAAEVQTAENVWGIILSAEDVTPAGLKLVITQSGGEPTGELQTGIDYVLEQRSGDNWTAVESLMQESEIAWEAIAYLIPMDDTTEMDISWEWLYGTLPAGEYRLGKEIMDFRGPGDYDTQMYYVGFGIA